ncbi:MAG: insulinase family protein [Oscillospiraceae bacterium]|nr:insulinase family protein [Oscillospiraceae bacterium]
MTYKKLKNGLRVLIDPIKGAKTATINVTVGVGSRMEKTKERGISHLIEHCFLNGSGKYSYSEFNEKLDELACFYNAGTSYEYTSYFITVPAKRQAEAMDLWFDMILKPHFDADRLDQEKKIVYEELKEYNEDGDPEPNIFFKEESFLANSIVGNERTIFSFKPEDLRAFVKKYYVPERMIISATGNINESLFLKKIDKHFKNLPNTGNPVNLPQAQYSVFRRIGVDEDYNQSYIQFTFPLYFNNINKTELRNALELGLEYLLNDFLREEQQITYGVLVESDRFLNEGLLHIVTNVSSEAESEAIRDILGIVASYGKMFDEDAEFFEKIITPKYTNTLMLIEDLKGPDHATRIAEGLLYKDKILTFDEKMEEFRRPTFKAELKNLTETIFDFEKASVIILSPNSGDAEANCKYYQELLDFYANQQE